MYSRIIAGRALRLGLLVALVVLALGACSGGDSSAQEEADKAGPLPEVDKALRPGEYRSEEFKPSISSHLGKGWTNVAPELSDKLAISPGREPGAPLLIRRKER